MATMQDADRTAVAAQIQRDWSDTREVVAGVTKADVKAAVDAIDDWVHANASSFNNALPTAAKNGLTSAQKSRLLRDILRKRYEKGV
jgi:hypothetical protein